MKRDARPRAGQSPNEDWVWTEAGLQCADVAGHCRLVFGCAGGIPIVASGRGQIVSFESRNQGARRRRNPRPR